MYSKQKMHLNEIYILTKYSKNDKKKQKSEIFCDARQDCRCDRTSRMSVCEDKRESGKKLDK